MVRLAPLQKTSLVSRSQSWSGWELVRPLFYFPKFLGSRTPAGVTPFASILKDIWYRQRENRLGSLRRVEFFWICRDAPAFGWFQSVLAEVEASQADPNFLRISIYLTSRTMSEDMLWNIVVNDTGVEYDPLTLLRTRTLFGRPDWMAIYGQLRGAIEGGDYLPGSTSQLQTKVGVWALFQLS